jgi:hypothetical protein
MRTDTPSLLLTVPILSAMRPIEGWFQEEEADLLIAAAAWVLQHLPEPLCFVEVGSFCGRSTVVLGRVVRALRPQVKVYAIDPHQGLTGALDRGLNQGEATYGRFCRNIDAAGVSGQIEAMVCKSWETDWHQPIGLLFIDGLHDYSSVERDFRHFDPWVIVGGLVAFHDYGDEFPGVRTFVGELLDSGRYLPVERIRSLFVLRKMDSKPAALR